jgi:hypothetical protein
MPYCQDLPELERVDLYVLMQKKANEEAQHMKKILLSRMASQTEQPKESYLTQFKGEWFSLLCLWMENKVTNEFVNECLKAGHVISL